ncbi:MAG: NAD-dependent epimerase/dehydratase family protein [Kofleriaceae bacterium]
MTAPIIILGCGFLGSHIARAGLAAGRTVRVLARGTGRMQPLGAAGAEVKFLDVGVMSKIPQSLGGLHGAMVVYSVPPITTLRPGQAIRAAMQAAYGIGASSFIYLSSSGLYGDKPDDDVWIDEDTPLAVDHGMQNVRSDEEELERHGFDTLRAITLRLAPVYGKGKGIRPRLREGKFKMLDEGEHATSRIYIDDFVRVVFAAEEKAQNKSMYLVADDEPTTQLEYATWLCNRLNLPMPGKRALYEPGKPATNHRNRKFRNTRMKTELGIELLYPTFREGEAAIDTWEATA